MEDEDIVAYELKHYATPSNFYCVPCAKKFLADNTLQNDAIPLCFYHVDVEFRTCDECGAELIENDPSGQIIAL